jgi:hypothetical protein
VADGLAVRPPVRCPDSRGFVPGQQFVDTDEIVAIEKAFCREHCWIARAKALLMGWTWLATDEQLKTICEQMRAVTFSPALRRPCDASGMGRAEGEIIIADPWTWCAEEITWMDARNGRSRQAPKQRPEATGPAAGSLEDPGTGMVLPRQLVR